jgi:hypothetical protein
MSDRFFMGVGITGCVLWLITAAAFIQHCLWTIGLLMADATPAAGKIAIAVLGIFVPPFGALHGVWLWVN